jgi:hypothetical protein
MKKFVAFVLVMAMAAVVSAAPMTGPYLDVDMSTPGHVNVVFMQGATNGPGSGGEISIGLAGATNIVVTDLTPLPDYVGNLLTGWAWGFQGVVGPQGDGVLVQKIASAGKGTPGMGEIMSPITQAPYAGTFAFGFDYDAPMRVEFSGLWDGMDTSPLSFDVPEPMTMSLLGLGGLVAARRRRA